MTSFESTMQLSATPAAAWAFVVERGREIEPLRFDPQGAQAVGTLNHLSGRVLGVLPLRGVSRTLVWDPPTTCVFESIKPSWPVRARITETFTPVGTGTRHCIRYEVTPRGLIGQLAAPIFCRLMRRSRRRYQARLRAALASAEVVDDLGNGAPGSA
jgi:hypothetical protein